MGKAAATRLEILHKAFDLIYEHGYQATSVDKILESTHVTKGAFYYHFKNKDEMGIAMIKEVITPILEKGLITPLSKPGKPTDIIYNALEQKLMNDPGLNIDFGCPTNNLVQEMSPLNAKFYKALRSVLDKWIRTIENILLEGKQRKHINTEVDARKAAEFIVASYEGVKSIGKIYGRAAYQNFLTQIRIYLQTLT